MAGLRATNILWPGFLLLLIASVLTFVRPARAEDARESALARSLFEEGVALGDRGDWVGASDRFARAHSLKPTSAVAFNWGRALMQTGHLVEARELLASVQRDPMASEALKRDSARQLEVVARRIAHVRVHVPHVERSDLSIDIDTRPLPRAAWDVLSPVDPGTHTIVLRERGDERAREQITLREGEQRGVTIALPGEEQQEAVVPFQPVDAPREERSAPRDKAPLYKNWKLWTAVGAVVVAGVVVGVVLSTRKDEAAAPIAGNASPGVIRW